MIGLGKYFIQTFGCQMNERDSERIAGILEDRGYVASPMEEADIVLLNTCTVRENANNKLYGHLGQLKSHIEKNPEVRLVLCGCMMQEDGVKDYIKGKFPFVSAIFGTGNIEKFGDLLEQLEEGSKVFDISLSGDDGILLNKNHKFPFKSGVNIMFGCDNFCSYCIVPYVRGRERSRSPQTILDEIRLLVADGVSEIMLLGQNVNSYGKGLSEEINFAGLLKEVVKIDGLKRIRFMTSHPKDISDELIDTIGSYDKICKHIHLPLQSGSSKVLKEMNRHYDKDRYLSIVEKLRKVAPDIAITTDIIVGFPTEEEIDFLETVDVVEKVGFDSAFTFIYSKRSKTPAALLPNASTEAEIKERFDRLLDKIHIISQDRIKRFEGTTQTVLVEHVNERDDKLVTGRIDSNFIVHLPGDASMIGKYIPVRLNESKGFYFMGESL